MKHVLEWSNGEKPYIRFMRDHASRDAWGNGVRGNGGNGKWGEGANLDRIPFPYSSGMPRSLRLGLSGAYDHVMARGKRRKLRPQVGIDPIEAIAAKR